MIILRPATHADSANLFAWRNDPNTRRASVSQDPVTLDDHEQWLSRSLADPQRVLYIASSLDGLGKDEPIGMCRFDLQADGVAAEVSINLNPDFRGRGLAGGILDEAIKRFLSDFGAPIVLTATIRLDNDASRRIFARCGFDVFAQSDEFVRLTRPATN